MTFEETLQTAEAELLHLLREEEILVGTTKLGLTKEQAIQWGETYGGAKRQEIYDFIAQQRAFGMALLREDPVTAQ